MLGRPPAPAYRLLSVKGEPTDGRLSYEESSSVCCRLGGEKGSSSSSSCAGRGRSKGGSCGRYILLPVRYSWKVRAPAATQATWRNQGEGFGISRGNERKGTYWYRTRRTWLQLSLYGTSLGAQPRIACPLPWQRGLSMHPCTRPGSKQR